MQDANGSILHFQPRLTPFHRFLGRAGIRHKVGHNAARAGFLQASNGATVIEITQVVRFTGVFGSGNIVVHVFPPLRDVSKPSYSHAFSLPVPEQE
ncbi:MAG: hypothetical protein DWQ01_19340 [Planctomycetota bacterium]|nr:MAG: hypothetical protein DWQ01_19340 [Planctomycetota bacterium]